MKRITIAKRMRAKLKQVKDQLRRRMHQPIPVQGRWLASVVRGHMAYYAVPGNSKAVEAFRNQATRHWLKALRRRSQKGPAPDLGTDAPDPTNGGYRRYACCIRFLKHASPLRTQGRSPVR